MDKIINLNGITFKMLEEKIFRYVCSMAAEMTKIILEGYDKEIHDGRDKKRYRDKDIRQTTIKTLYGEISYSRKLYNDMEGEGGKKSVYLLDEMLRIDRIGAMSANFAEKVIEAVTKGTYRGAAQTVSNTCGQAISHGGAWNLAQAVGERIAGEERALVERMESGGLRGEEEAKVLFEEMDGVYIKAQGEGHKKVGNKEVKVAVTYEGWDAKGRLVGKRSLAGTESAGEFHKKREAVLEQKYNVDEIECRILNGDGGSWIKDDYDPDTIFQLDAFHVRQAIKRKINADKKAQKDIEGLYGENDVEGMLEYIDIYATSVESNDIGDKRGKKARELYEYLDNNREGLVPYQKRGVRIPEPPEGVTYKNMGVQENQNFTIITNRMKGGRKRWSDNGANNMCKLLYRKENGELEDTVNRYGEALLPNIEMREVIEILSAAQAPKRDGRGSRYVDTINMGLPLRDAVRTASRDVMMDWLR